MSFQDYYDRQDQKNQLDQHQNDLWEVEDSLALQKQINANKKQVTSSEKRSLQVLQESLKELEESKQAGADVLVTVAEQGERIDNIGHGVNRIDGHLTVANRMITRIQNAVSALVIKPFQRKVRLFRNPPPRPELRIEFSPSGEESGVDVIKKDGSTYNVADTVKDAAARAFPMIWGKSPHQKAEEEEKARQELLEKEENERIAKQNARGDMTDSYKELINNVLNQASTEIVTLKDMSLTLNTELDRQNNKLEKIGDNTTKTNDKFKRTNRRIETELC